MIVIVINQVSLDSLDNVMGWLELSRQYLVKRRKKQI